MKGNLIFVWLRDLSNPRPGLGPRSRGPNRWKLGKGIERGIAESQIL